MFTRLVLENTAEKAIKVYADLQPMLGPAIQRFALLLVTFGGFLEVVGGVRGDYTGLPSLGIPVMLLGVAIGVVGLYVAVSASFAD